MVLGQESCCWPWSFPAWVCVLEHLQPALPDWGTPGSAPALGTPSLVLNQCLTSLLEDAAAKAFDTFKNLFYLGILAV